MKKFFLLSALLVSSSFVMGTNNYSGKKSIVKNVVPFKAAFSVKKNVMTFDEVLNMKLGVSFQKNNNVIDSSFSPKYTPLFVAGI